MDGERFHSLHDRRSGRGHPDPNRPRRDRAAHLSATIRPGTSQVLFRYSSGPRPGDGRAEAGLAALPARVPVRSRVRRGSRSPSSTTPRTARERRCSSASRCLAIVDRLPRPVRPRRVHHGAADQGDRHPQGAGRPDPRHRPAARLAILQAGGRRQPGRLAGRLVGDARLAERLRRADRPHSGAVRPRRPARSRHRASAPSPATPSGSPALNPIHALRYE